ncbi:MAG TPA: pyridine nucleotide-disulfide oxidoreductase [Clostridiales bacterium]|nr:pyridine nucleotide-disulfide oxidoreductase [Clostridiales bacterium]
MKVSIVGGVAGGASTAARLRRLDENAEITLFERGEYISFANCGLPYYIGEVIREKDQLVVQTPESMKRRFHIDVRVFNEVTRILPDQKKIEVRDLKTDSVYLHDYDKLVLSPGAEPFKPPIPGVNSSRVFTLRNIPDTFRIKTFVDEQKPRHAVVVGGGFIGIETAENLHARGVQVAIVELADHIIGPLDFDMAAIVHQHLKSKNVEFYLNDGVKSIRETENGMIVTLSGGREIRTDMVMLGIGVKPETRLAREAGLKIGSTGGIWVDETLRTSDPDIYAVGDAIEVEDAISGNPSLMPLAGPANRQGRMVAGNLVGMEEKYSGTQGTAIVKVFDITVAMTGNNERTLVRNGTVYEKSFTHSASHAGYYPGAIPLGIKLLFSKTDGRILGAQVIGYEGVDKRLDVIATAIHAGMTVHDLEKLELAYAPPYSSAKDPVNMAGYVASNILLGDCRNIHWDEIDSLDKDKVAIIDVRTSVEFNMGHIEGAVNIPIEEIRSRTDEIPKDKDIVLYCQIGTRAYFVYRILSQLGFENIKNLSGGFKTYQAGHQKFIDEHVQGDSRITSNDMLKASACMGEGCSTAAKVKLDACGLQCPGPIMKVNQSIAGMNFGEVLEVKATDPAFANDVKAWCSNTGNTLAGLKQEKGLITAYIKKGGGKVNTKVQSGNGKTMVVFSGDLDKAIASFIIANGAAAMGNQVTMFFTFWGLNILRKQQYIKVKKNMLERMFGMMMPRGTKKLSLSKMNMGGIGAKLIRYIMKSKNVESLEDLIEKAKSQGVKLIACSMSMDVMGLKKEELLDGVEVGGVAYFLDSADRSNMSLFI